jgi:hypothetical protein
MHHHEVTKRIMHPHNFKHEDGNKMSKAQLHLFSSNHFSQPQGPLPLDSTACHHLMPSAPHFYSHCKTYIFFHIPPQDDNCSVCQSGTPSTHNMVKLMNSINHEHHLPAFQNSDQSITLSAKKNDCHFICI